MFLRYILLVIGVLMLFIVPTSAVMVGSTGSTDAIGGKINIDSAPDTDGQYAEIKRDEVRLNLDRLNDRAVTHADNVFTISADDDDVERVWIENDVPGLTFYRGDDPTTTISESTPLEPSAGSTIGVGVSIDTREAGGGTETFTVVAQYGDGEEDDSESDIDGSSLTVSPTTAETGETVTVDATYRNDGDERGTETARLTVDGTVVDQQSIELKPEETKTVSFERRMDWSGAYDIGIAGVGTESVTVEGPPIDIVDATIDDSELTAGESTAVRAIVRNPTNTAVDRTLEVAVDGTVVDSRAVMIPANGERTVVFERRFDGAGTYEIEVSGVSAGTVTVDEPATFSIRNRGLSAVTTAAIAPPATAGLLVLAMAANRRWAFVQ